MSRAVFRCDASAAIGGGHVMRSLAAAETLAWAGWRVAFATGAETLATVPALARSGHAVVAPDAPPAADVAVFDHYGLGAPDETAARVRAGLVVAFDDRPTRRHDADVLLDPTPGRATDAYRHLLPPAARALLGAGHAQLRREWRARRPAALAARRARAGLARIVVSMGATDPTDATSRALDALAVAGLAAEVEVILGAAAPRREAVRARLARGQRLLVDPPDYAERVAAADLVVGAAGSSMFERACLGVPSLVVPVADNQSDLVAAFAAAGAAVAMPADRFADAAAAGAAVAALARDEDGRARMSAAAAALVDGCGPLRLLLALAGDVAVRGGRVTVRLADGDDDALYLLALQSQPSTRRFARSARPPTRAEHLAWFARTRADLDRVLMIVDCDGAPCGMLRLDRRAGEGGGFEVSIAVDEARRGLGIGGAALALARRIAGASDLDATVLAGNDASLAMFTAAGYRPVGGNLLRSRAA